MFVIIILGILDILSGIVLLTYSSFLLFHGFAGYLGAYSLFKGMISFLSSVGMKYYFDWMGIVDIITGVALLLVTRGVSSGIIQTIGAIAILKGLYSFLRGFFKV